MIISKLLLAKSFVEVFRFHARLSEDGDSVRVAGLASRTSSAQLGGLCISASCGCQDSTAETNMFFQVGMYNILLSIIALGPRKCDGNLGVVQFVKAIFNEALPLRSKH